MGPFRRILRSNSGAAAVEFAMVVWLLILVCLAVVEFGRGIHVRNELSSAGDRAARMILTDPEVLDSELEAAVLSAYTGPRPERLQSQFGTETVDGISFRTMVIEYPFSLVIPGFSDAITLSVSRRVPTA